MIYDPSNSSNGRLVVTTEHSGDFSKIAQHLTPDDVFGLPTRISIPSSPNLDLSSPNMRSSSSYLVASSSVLTGSSSVLVGTSSVLELPSSILEAGDAAERDSLGNEMLSRRLHEAIWRNPNGRIDGYGLVVLPK